MLRRSPAVWGIEVYRERCVEDRRASGLRQQTSGSSHDRRTCVHCTEDITLVTCWRRLGKNLDAQSDEDGGQSQRGAGTRLRIKQLGASSLCSRQLARLGLAINRLGRGRLTTNGRVGGEDRAVGPLSAAIWRCMRRPFHHHRLYDNLLAHTPNRRLPTACYTIANKTDCPLQEA